MVFCYFVVNTNNTKMQYTCTLNIHIKNIICTKNFHIFQENIEKIN